MSVIMYGSEIMIWREKKRSRIMAVQMANLRFLLGIRRIDKVPNVRIRQFMGSDKGCGRLMNVFSMVWACGENGE